MVMLVNHVFQIADRGLVGMARKVNQQTPLA